MSGLDTHLSPSSNLKQKSVTFSQDVVSQDGKVASCKLTTHASVVDENVSKPALETCSWSCNSGVVIQNGLEMKEVDLQIQEISEIETTEKESKITHTHKTTLSTRAKLLAKMKELRRDEEPCPCRTVTRPTTALLTESRNGKSGTKETSSRNEKLLVCWSFMFCFCYK